MRCSNSRHPTCTFTSTTGLPMGSRVRQLWIGEEFLGTDPMPNASFSQDGKITGVVRQSPNTPPEVWAGEIGRWKQVSSINAGLKPVWGETRNVHWMNGK